MPDPAGNRFGVAFNYHLVEAIPTLFTDEGSGSGWSVGVERGWRPEVRGQAAYALRIGRFTNETEGKHLPSAEGIGATTQNSDANWSVALERMRRYALGGGRAQAVTGQELRVGISDGSVTRPARELTGDYFPAAALDYQAWTAERFFWIGGEFRPWHARLLPIRVRVGAGIESRLSDADIETTQASAMRIKYGAVLSSGYFDDYSEPPASATFDPYLLGYGFYANYFVPWLIEGPARRKALEEPMAQTEQLATDLSGGASGSFKHPSAATVAPVQTVADISTAVPDKLAMYAAAGPGQWAVISAELAEGIGSVISADGEPGDVHHIRRALTNGITLARMGTTGGDPSIPWMVGALPAFIGTGLLYLGGSDGSQFGTGLRMALMESAIASGRDPDPANIGFEKSTTYRVGMLHNYAFADRDGDRFAIDIDHKLDAMDGALHAGVTAAVQWKDADTPNEVRSNLTLMTESFGGQVGGRLGAGIHVAALHRGTETFHGVGGQLVAEVLIRIWGNLALAAGGQAIHTSTPEGDGVGYGLTFGVQVP
ncbi:MAG: hypothetical protein HYV03_06830 [Deltaproteobacteria bacterium]|nr:hypothetical protein [Deltaproteobacteria bacterium]